MEQSTIPPPGARPLSPSRLAWLRDETRGWVADGLVTDEEAAAVLARYGPARTLSLARLMLALGSAFVGVGLIWLVAANLDRLSPLTRFLLVTVVWLAVVVGAHVGAVRREAAGRGATASPLVGAARGLAAIAYGGVVLQAAQSLQVPAYDPALLGYWGLGALVYAYAVRGLAPLVVGLLVSLMWLVQTMLDTAPSGLGAVLGLLLAACTAAAVAVLHDRFGLTAFVTPWRGMGAVLVLVGLFVAAIPLVTAEDFEVEPWLVGVAVAAVVAVVAAVVTGHGDLRYEPLAAVAVTLVAVGLVLWEPASTEGDVTAADWAQAAVSIGVYVAAATWIAALGIMRDTPVLTFVAMAALVVFTTFQSFAVFARVIEGAWLFVLLGLVFLGSGYGFDRGRRGLEASLEGAPT